MAFHRRSAAVLFALHFLLLTTTASSSPASLPEQQDDDDMRALLHLKRAQISGAGSGSALRQWSPEPGAHHHCSWPGVTCDARSGRVVALALRRRRLGGELSPAMARLTELKALAFPSAGLRGEIPPQLWRRLRRLQALDLAGNSLRGRLPAAFPEGLESLDLSGNRLSGAIPPRIGELARLRVLDLSGNRLTGGVPPELRHCKGLVRVDLSRNLLRGRMPSGLAELKDLKLLALSGNDFRGEVPVDLVALTADNNKVSSGEETTAAGAVNAADAVSPVHLVTAHSVTGGELFHVSPIRTIIRQLIETRPGTSNGSRSSSSRSNGVGGGLGVKEIAAIASASAIAVVLLVALTLCICKRKWPQRESRHSSRGKEVKVFADVEIGVHLTYEAVVRASGNFNASNCIGNGGFGATYRAEVAPGVLVAIKRLAVGKQHGDKEFHAEVRILGQCRHPHLVTLLGYHISDAEMFLIYNYLPGGNLERFIQERGKRPISWRKLHKIALDVACALEYMHDECSPRILHRDVKPNNILLDNECNAYLSDFGLARFLPNSETHATTDVAGTFGYVAPEYATSRRVSDKADVYSYGVVLLELISDKKVLDPSFSPFANGFNIVSWAVEVIQSGRVREFFIKGLWEKAPHDDLVDFLNLAVQCTQESLPSRPTMKHVVQRLREIRPPF